MIIYHNITGLITIGTAIDLYENGKLAVIVNDGKDIVLESERVEPNILYYE
jgi:hypothetical protein